MDDSISEIWLGINQWLAVNASDVLQTLQVGATENEIEKIEDEIQVELPEDLKSFYRIHNGQYRKSVGLLEGWRLLSLDEICFQWKSWMELCDAGDFFRRAHIVRRRWIVLYQKLADFGNIFTVERFSNR